MDENSWRGNLAATPLPQLLFLIWDRKESGHLRVRREGVEKNLYFSNGDLALAEGSFSDKDFEKRLTLGQILNPQQVEEGSSYALKNKVSFLRALVECGLLSPSRAWEILKKFWREDLALLFDWPEADFVFDPDSTLPEVRIFALASTPEVIVQGIRQMKNFSLIEALLPLDSQSLEVLSPSHAEILKLDAHEKYVFSIIKQIPRLEELYAASQLGRKETQRVIFTLLHLGVIGLAQQKNKVKPLVEPSLADLEKTWNDFNDRCSYIFKYISKEIGPVALSVLEKALDEVRAKLGPPLQGLELRADGRIEFKPFPLMSLNLSSEENYKNFIHVLNEILVAEVLAIKKTLGNAHEAAVVRNLERIGEPT